MELNSISPACCNNSGTTNLASYTVRTAVKTIPRAVTGTTYILTATTAVVTAVCGAQPFAGVRRRAGSSTSFLLQ